ncbi:MAG: cupin domain-containing protein [Victivallales bacterium]|nr:cupin domain-containing protein [Victivallales bacterium]
MKYQFGDKLRKVRKRSGMTMKEVAERAGVSESLISQIERNHISPSIDTLLNIAEILHLDMDYLFRDLNRSTDINVVKKSERLRIVRNGVSFERLSRTSGDDDHGIEAYYLEIPPGGENGNDIYGHQGKELGSVLSGDGSLRIGGQSIKLREGDSVSFSSDSPHILKNTGDKPLRAFWVVTPPKMFT